MSDQLIVKLVPKAEAEREVESLKKKHKRLLITWIIVAALFGGLGAAISREFFPVMPDKLSPSEAARILQMQKGYAGYTLIKEEGGNGQVGHAIFCPNCATEIAMVNVSFLEPAPPEPGSRMAILMDLAKTAVAVAKTSPKKFTATAPAKIETVN